MKIFLSPPDVGQAEQQAIAAAIASGWSAPAGPDLDGFEREVGRFIGGNHGAVALSSGTAALHLALLAVGVQPGDEVFLSSFTFAATANAVRYCGAEPVFIDSEPESWNMSPALLAEEFDRARRLNRMPRAVVVVDLYGQCADYDAIVGLCMDHGVAVIEDAAEALGATYKGRHAGTLGHVGVFSFNGNKIITTSGGGMLVSNDPAITERVRYLSTQARQPVAHYEHHEVGFNYRMSNLLAAMGRVQLQRLPGFIERRLEVNARYKALLGDVPDVSFMPVPEWSGWNGWLSCVLFDSQATSVRVREHLAHIGVESRPLWWPMHRQPVFARCRARVDGTSDDLAARGLCLPSGSALTSDQLSLVASTVRTALGEARRSKWLVIDGEAAASDERTA